MITSVQNPRVKAARKLHEAKGRKAEGLFLLEGTALLEEALACNWPIETIYATEAWQLRHQLPDATVVADHVLAHISTLQTPEGVVALARLRGHVLPPLHERSLWLVADAIQDPANLGAMIRTADAAGADAIVVGPGTTDPWSPKAVRASMGSVLHLPVVQVADLAAARRPGMPWLALAPRAEKSLYDLDLRGPIALQVGNEAAGLSEAAIAAADATIAIPMPGKAESLNAAAAVAVCLFEAVRQRHVTGT